MKIGAIFPTTEIGTDPVAIRDWAQAAEELGYDHIVAYDHVLGTPHDGRDPQLMGPYTDQDDFHEPMVLFGFLAAATAKLELMTGILILPQRQTAIVAKQAAEVDLLSGGRLRLGVGSGWNYVEYEALNTSWEDRGAVYSEQVELLRRFWREPVVDFDGRFHRIDRAGIKPRPTRDIPIWMGAFAPPALRRAAKLADGLIFGSAGEGVVGLWSRLREMVAAEGRDAAAFGAEASVDYSAGPDAWRTECERWREAGGTHFSLRAMDTAAEVVGAKHVGYSGPADYIRALEEFKKEVD